MEWLSPWWSTEEQDSTFHETFESELQLEVGPGHFVFGIPAKLIGRHDACDDALFELCDGTCRVAVVHLTWAKHEERLPWPRTEIYASLESWADQRMCPEHEDALEQAANYAYTIGNFKEAFVGFSQLWSLGRVSAAKALAEIYLRGEGTTIDAPKAVELLRRAIEAGDGNAAFNLAAIYHSGGHGMPQDLNFSRHFFIVAKRLGCKNDIEPFVK